MNEVEKLEKAVANAKPDISKWNIPSDHEMNLQIFNYHSNDVTLEIIVGTWNILNQRWMKYTAGRDESGVGFGDPALGSGLHTNPVTFYGYTSQRQDAVVERIVLLFNTYSSHPIILFLQEVGADILEKLRKALLENVFLAVSGGPNNYNCTLTSKHEDVDSVESGDDFLILKVNYPVDVGPLVIANVHLSFNTLKNLTFWKRIEDCKEVLVGGDYNIPVKPISKSAISEGCTHTIREVIQDLTVGETAPFKCCHIGIAATGTTIFNVKKNCVVPVDPLDENYHADHFDNLIFFEKGECSKSEFVLQLYPPVCNFPKLNETDLVVLVDKNTGRFADIATRKEVTEEKISRYGYIVQERDPLDVHKLFEMMGKDADPAYWPFRKAQDEWYRTALQRSNHQAGKRKRDTSPKRSSSSKDEPRE